MFVLKIALSLLTGVYRAVYLCLMVVISPIWLLIILGGGSPYLIRFYVWSFYFGNEDYFRVG